MNKNSWKDAALNELPIAYRSDKNIIKEIILQLKKIR